MVSNSKSIILDDRLLIEHLLVGLEVEGELNTTSYWYYRACRAAVVGAGGHLSGPFQNLGEAHQNAAIHSLLALPDSVGIPHPRSTVPLMARVAERHPRLNLLNLEATAAGLCLNATLMLSEESASGILPTVLDAEGLAWRTHKCG